MTLPTDRIIFLDRLGRRVYEGFWTGEEWPPPPRLSLMRGLQSGVVSVVEEEIAPPDVVAAARRHGTIIETRYRLRNASTMPKAAGPQEHWFRGAEYVPEGDDLTTPTPDGWRWVNFSGGSLDGEQRLVRAEVEVGSTYERMVPVEEIWKWDGERFVLALDA